jgi:hypothetical protein
MFQMADCYCIGFQQNAMAEVPDIQWLYLAAHGCKTYGTVNLNLPEPLGGQRH